jgi:hypothetical protein
VCSHGSNISQKEASLELFNPTYWKQDAEFVARTRQERMKNLVANIQI